jgi:N-acetylmuramoyl-L-alanine amidase
VSPGKNKIAWDQTPHFNARPEGTVIDTIVLHHTASTSLPGTVRWFRTPEAKVSAHFTIGKDGAIIQHLSTYYRGWHAGVSRDAQDRQNVNNFSVGIEIVNAGDGKDTYTEVQLDAVEHIVSVLCRRFPITQIVSHEFIAQPQGRKNDPLNFPWERMKRFGVALHYGRNPKG